MHSQRNGSSGNSEKEGAELRIGDDIIMKDRPPQPLQLIDVSQEDTLVFDIVFNPNKPIETFPAMRRPPPHPGALAAKRAKTKAKNPPMRGRVLLVSKPGTAAIAVFAAARPTASRCGATTVAEKGAARREGSSRSRQRAAA